MALSLESANKVRQKAVAAVGTQDKGTSAGQNTAVYFALKAFFADWAINHGNADLQWIPFSTTDVTTNTGYSPIGGVTSTVYFVYARNPGLGDGTNAYIRLYNDTTNTTNTLAYVTGLISDDFDSFVFVSGKGIVYGTDLTISSDTGTDATESAAANAANGFVIVGA